MLTRRSFPSASFAMSAIYVFGGYDGLNTLRTCEFYDLETRQWRTLPSMDTARSNAGSTVMGKNIYVVGGWDGACLSSVEILNLISSTWTTVSSLPSPTTGIRCSLLPYQIFNQLESQGGTSRVHNCVLC